MCQGTMSVTTVQAGSLYQITVTVDSGWLQANANDYPVSIDLTMLAEPYSSDAIIDAPVYNLKPTQNFGSYTYNRVGYYSGWGIGRTIVRPDGMLNSTLYQSLNASQVNSVLFTVTEATGSADQTIQVHKLYNGENWTESNVTYDSMGYSCGVVTTAQLGNNAETTFDLTSLVKQWINGTNIASNGFMMKGVNENTVNKAFCSTEFGTTSMRPYMTLNYTPMITVSHTHLNVLEGKSTSFTIDVCPSQLEVSWGCDFNYINVVPQSDDRTILVYGNKSAVTSITITIGNTTISIPVIVNKKNMDGTYFIKNKGTGHYMEVEGGSTADDANIQQWDFHGMNWSNWIIELQNDGFYTIKSVYTSKYVSVYRGANAGGVPIKQASSPTADNVKWSIIPTNSGAYRFVCKTTNGANAVISVDKDEDINGTNLRQYLYTADSDYRDEWIIGWDVSMLGVNVNDNNGNLMNTAEGFEDIETLFVNNGCERFYQNTDTFSAGVTQDQLLHHIQNSTITLVCTHGDYNMIELTNGNLTDNKLLQLGNQYFANSELIIYLACKTGDGGENASNLVTKSVNAGINSAIGFEDNIPLDAAQAWKNRFFQLMVSNKDSSNPTLEGLLILTDWAIQTHQHYSGTYDADSNDDTPPESYSMGNYVLAGSNSVPDVFPNS